MNVLKHIFAIYYRFRYRQYCAVKCDELPNKLDHGVFYLLQDDGFTWAIKLKCPCGCCETFTLNLVGARPVWSATKLGKDLTVSPSIWRKSGCKSHFWIIRGKIKWASRNC